MLSRPASEACMDDAIDSAPRTVLLQHSSSQRILQFYFHVALYGETSIAGLWLHVN